MKDATNAGSLLAKEIRTKRENAADTRLIRAQVSR